MTGVDPKGLDLASVAFNEAYEASINGPTASLSVYRGVTAAITAYLAALTPLKGAPVAWRGVVDGRTAFLCRTRDEIDRLASDYNAVIEPLFASQPLPETEEKRWPHEFLGRCAFCLDNAYLNGSCISMSNEDCLIRRARIAPQGENP